MKRNYKKGPFFDRGYIATFIVRFTGLLFLIFSFVALILFFVLKRDLGEGYYKDIVTLSELKQALWIILLVTGIIQVALISGLFSVVFLIWSHRVSGPLKRFQKSLHQIAKEGWRGQITFREGDMLPLLARAFNRFSVKLHRRENKFQQCLDEADELLREYEQLHHREKNVGLLEERLRNLYKKMSSLSKRE
ncbi:MAG: hypothetical protein NUV91_02325 [Candidatus Omnitrophica bacterium]|nr:hypothetical protein [Candidatus Omnitrophota bacterium]